MNQVARTKNTMNLFEVMDAVDQLVERVEKVEQLAHEPQNWIHGMSLEKKGMIREETHDECMERFKFNHPEYGTDKCWCPDCLGGETLTMVSKVCEQHGRLYIKGNHTKQDGE